MNKFERKSDGEKSQSYLMTDCQWASLSWCQATLWTSAQFFFLLECFLRHLRVCYFMAPSLTRGRVCNLLLLLGHASALPLGFESLEIREHILLPQLFSLPHPGRPGPHIYIPQV
jgi:hypothetical protein